MPSGQAQSTTSVAAPERCPICKSDTYMNPDLKILISTCFHKLCEACVIRFFATGTGYCPTCKKAQSRQNYKKQIFEDLNVEREVSIRKRVMKIYNLRQEDFDNLSAYNDFLEMVEDVVFDLVNNKNTSEVEQKMKSFKLKNLDVIKKNEQKNMHEQKLIDMHYEKEKIEKENVKNYYIKQLDIEKELKNKQKDELINKLQKSNKSAKSIVDENKKNADTAIVDLKKSSNIHVLDSINSSINRMNQWDNIDVNSNTNELSLFDFYNDQKITYNKGILDNQDRFKLLSHYYDPISQPITNEENAKTGGYLLELTYRRNVESLLIMGLDYFKPSNNKNSE